MAELSPYRSVPDYLIPESGLESQALRAVTAGYLVTNPTPLTHDQMEQLITSVSGEVAPGPDPILVETHQPNQNDGAFRWIVLGIGAAVAAAIIASMVSLLRVDSAGDDRTLAAVGASPGIRRSIVASSTALLSFGGALLALPAGYLGLVAIMSDRRAGYPLAFPAPELAALLVGLPLAATLAAWVLVRRQPRSLAAVPRV